MNDSAMVVVKESMMSDMVEILKVSLRNMEGDRAMLRAALRSAQQQIDQWRQLYEQSEARICALLLEKEREMG